MSAFLDIKQKLNTFIKKYYKAQLIKGVLLFLTIGVLFFMLLLGVEYFLWLNSSSRLILLIILFGVELFLLYKFIVQPLLLLYQIKNGLDDKRASFIIGKHFPEIDDKLYNLVDLDANNDQSELLIASIDQRSKSLLPFKFSNAVQYKKSYSYIKWLIIPLLLVLAIYLTGDLKSFFSSYKRVVNYDLAFEKPAPFKFHLLPLNQSILKNEPIHIAVATRGEIKPEMVYISINGENYLMQENNGVFNYEIKQAKESFSFNFVANDFTSNSFFINVKEIPSIVEFDLKLDYPNYTNKRSEIIKNGGNAVLLEGTRVSWLLNTENTSLVSYTDKDTILNFNKRNDEFVLQKKIYNSLEYSIATSNTHISNFEKVDYNFKVIKDQYPAIRVEQKVDSLQANQWFFSGNLSDDYGITSLSIVYYPKSNPENKKELVLLKPNTSVASFYYTFPSGLQIETGKDYSFYFQVVDNDGVNGSKKSKSAVFSSTLLDDNQLKNRELDSQNTILSNLDKSISNQKKQIKNLEDISDDQKEKSALSYNDKSKLYNILEQQKVQESQMQKFSNQLKDNLKKMQNDDELNKLLQERLERQEKQAEKNQKLLEELKNIADKLEKEELTKRLEELAKSQKSGQRNLEQLLELTKRYYVTEMASQLAKDLQKLANKQELLSKLNLFEEDSKKNQNKLNESFNKLAKKLEELLEDNNSLKKPIEIDTNVKDSDAVKEDQKSASEELNKQKGVEQSSGGIEEKADMNKANKKQKSAADKMQEIANKLDQSSAGGGGSNVAEDAEVLRQILDNLITFTFKQEDLINKINSQTNIFDNQSKLIVKQQELKTMFEHVDDSLFALSLRVPEISETINTQVTNVYYNLDKAVENITESNLYQGISYQKYVLNSGNTLADLLADILENMQQSMMPGKGEGEGQDFQLPDIIKGQAGLNEKLGEAGKGKESKPGKEGESGGDGEKGKKGENGKVGSAGEQGSNGNGGKGGKNGNNGENGQNGKDGEQGSGGKNGGNGKGENGQGGNGNYGLTEEGLKEIYEIYKQQETLKNKLEEQLQNMINNDDRKLGEKLVKQMAEFQDNLLENGITRSTMDKATIIQYQLLKLEGAAMKQGKKEERESNSNSNQFTNPILSRPAIFDNYKNENEILNRQVLPLRQNYQGKIKQYFKKND